MSKHGAKKLTNSILWGSAFILVGIVWLLDSFGVVSIDLRSLWPAIFIVIGLNILLDGIFDSWSK